MYDNAGHGGVGRQVISVIKSTWYLSFRGHKLRMSLKMKKIMSLTSLSNRERKRRWGETKKSLFLFGQVQFILMLIWFCFWNLSVMSIANKGFLSQESDKNIVFTLFGCILAVLLWNCCCIVAVLRNCCCIVAVLLRTVIVL